MVRRGCSLLISLAHAATTVAAQAAPKAPVRGRPVQLRKAPAKRTEGGGRPGDQGRGKKGANDERVAAPKVDELARLRVAGALHDEPVLTLPPEILALQRIERELFPELSQRSEGRGLLPADAETGAPELRPVVLSSGLAPSSPLPREVVPSTSDGPRDGFLAGLEPSALSSRWDPRVLRYLTFFRDDPRGRSMVLAGHRKSGKYEDVIRAAFRAEGVPEDLLWLAMVESAFEPTVKSPAGAAGLFQFMPDGARQYGLRLDRWTDERRDPQKSATAAAKYLADLHKRFGTWELALAAYNMGHGALLQAVRKYGTNDFWELARLEAGLPWETTLYVPKILALATVARNPAVFGLATVAKDPPLAAESVTARGGLPLSAIAQAAGRTPEEIAFLNPHLRTDRLPLAPRGPDTMGELVVHVPRGTGALCALKLPAYAAREPAFVEHTVRLGQSLSSLATDLDVSRAKILSWNGLDASDVIKPGDLLMLPAESARKLAVAGEKPVVVVPLGPALPPGTQRVFYRVVRGDVIRGIAVAFSVDESDLVAWNALDPAARLQDGMTLQLFVDRERDLSRVVVLRESEVQVLVVSSEEFFAYFEDKKGRRRVEVICGDKDSWTSLASRYRLSVALLERINRRSRSTPLQPGDKLVVYTGVADKDPPTSRELAVTGKSVPESVESREAVGARE